MKRVLIAIVMIGIGTLAAMGQASGVVNSSRSNIKNNIVFSQGPDGKTRCTVANTPCTKAQLEQVNTALAAMRGADLAATANKSGPEPGKQEPAKQAAHYSTTKSSIKTSSLAADGSLTCETTDGKKQPCTAAHIADLNNAAGTVSAPGVSGR